MINDCTGNVLKIVQALLQLRFNFISNFKALSFLIFVFQFPIATALWNVPLRTICTIISFMSYEYETNQYVFGSIDFNDKSFLNTY